ncbi:hypothetical protein ACO2Q8_11960 [Larkinella sp. VNQ87]|uniref:hypothetical protein n=1 Tax=Larkinella sp. VNQ87 TaxID=3400921 RepID=UPI003BFA85A8
MKAKYNYLLLTLWLLLNGACQSNKKTEEHHHHHPAEPSAQATTGPVAALEKQVLAVHDSVMPLISDLMRLQKEVSAKIEKTEGPARQTGLRISQQLQEADRAMMDWMHQYKGDTLKVLDQDQALKYLKQQQEKVSTMSQLMRKSLTDAENYMDR